VVEIEEYVVYVWVLYSCWWLVYWYLFIELGYLVVVEIEVYVVGECVLWFELFDVDCEW